MVATFVVEDGSGVASANSYLTKALADQYHENIGTLAALWVDLIDADKEQALRSGTHYLDGKYARRWKGIRSSGPNVLDWPRSGAIDTDQFAISSTTIPQGLLDACAEAALRSGDTVQNPTGLTPDVEGEGTITYKREKADQAEEETHYAGGMDQLITYTVIERLLHDLIHPLSGILLDRY